MNAKGFLLAVLLFAGVSTKVRGDNPSDQQPHSESYWRKRVARVHRGMKRSAVEKILPVHSSPQEDEAVLNGRYSLYAVDSEWVVKVPYDFHGFIADPKKNPHQLMHLYDNRVIGPIKLVHQHTNSLPTPLVGEWKASPKNGNNEAEAKEGGFYLLADGRGAWTGDEVGLTGVATYNPAAQTVTLITREEGGPTYTFSLAYNLDSKTLTVAKVRSTGKDEVPRVPTKLVLVRRAVEVPPDVLNLLGKPKA